MEAKYLAERLFLLVRAGCKKVHMGLWEWMKDPKGSVISNLGRAWRLGGECEREWEKQVETRLGKADEMSSCALAA